MAYFKIQNWHLHLNSTFVEIYMRVEAFSVCDRTWFNWYTHPCDYLIGYDKVDNSLVETYFVSSHGKMASSDDWECLHVHFW